MMLKVSTTTFWAYSRAHLKTKSRVSPLLGDLSSIKHNDTDKAEVLQHQFCQVFIREPEGDIPIPELLLRSLLAGYGVETKSGEVMQT